MRLFQPKKSAQKSRSSIYFTMPMPIKSSKICVYFSLYFRRKNPGRQSIVAYLYIKSKEKYLFYLRYFP